MATLDELIPMVAALNGERASPTTTSSGLFSHSNDTRNGQQTIVESSHPYRSGTITSQLVTFDDTVHMICVKFDDECRSAQVDDTLWLYIAMRDETFVPVGRYSGSKQWPEKTLLLPGNRLWFVFETSVLFDEVSVSADKLYGYRCTLSGLAIDESNSSVLLEQELTFICASACRQLVQVPKDGTNFEALAISEEETHELIQKHGSLLRKGLNLSHMPTVNELLKHSMPGKIGGSLLLSSTISRTGDNI
jgi:E3 ubiquitin-protein ligase MYCBP2